MYCSQAYCKGVNLTRLDIDTAKESRTFSQQYAFYYWCVADIEQVEHGIWFQNPNKGG